MENKMVSIIIPCYNDADYIEESVLSALNQTYPYKEVIVVDDGSDERTKVVLEKLEPKITKLITQVNKGQSSARNVGLKEAKGEYILMLDSDDFFDHSFCEKAVNIIERNEDVKIITCYTNRIKNSRKTLFKPQGGGLKDFLLKNCALGTSLFRRNHALQINGYDESMKNGFEDWEFFIRLLENGGMAHVIEEPLHNYRMRSNSTTSRANTKKYELLRYIYIKHKNLYIDNYESFIDFILMRLEREEREKNINLNRIDSKLGRKILQPLRFFKSILR